MSRRELADTLVFLPGAAGRRDFWRPLSDRLQHPGRREFLAWPGMDGAPPDPRVNSLDDLVSRVVDSIAGPVDLLAQSMGGVIAVHAALRKPDLVKHLVLAVTSGGVDVSALGAHDWRPDFLRAHPGTPRWFIDATEDVTPRLRELEMPVLLLWGDADPISPVAVGRRLAELLPRAELVVIPGGTHDLVCDRAAEVAPHIDSAIRR